MWHPPHPSRWNTLSPVRDAGIVPVRIRRRLQRIDEHRQRVQRFVRRAEGHVPLLVGEHAVRAEIGRVAVGDERRVSHQIAGAAMLVRRCVIDVFAILDADEIGNFRRIVRAAIPARKQPGCRGGTEKGPICAGLAVLRDS